MMRNAIIYASFKVASDGGGASRDSNENLAMLEVLAGSYFKSLVTEASKHSSILAASDMTFPLCQDVYSLET